MAATSVDPIFEEETRNTSLPILFPTIWKAYKNQFASVWQVHEVDLSRDYSDWVKLSDDEQFFLKMVLAFFASSDLIVNKNLAKRFINEFKRIEFVFAYTFQAAMENVHSEMYSALIDTYIKDINEKNKLFNAVENIPIIAKKAEWTNKWIESSRPMCERLVAFACVEGIFFSGSFCAIYWIKERGILKGLCLSNDFISRDEGMHTDFAVLTHSLMLEKISPEAMISIVSEAVELETEFITEALPCRLIGMNSIMMKEYIKFVANRLVKQFGYPEIYPNVNQPFTFMDRIALHSKSNFFEEKPSQYNKRAVEETSEDPYADL
jgi:ribonucleotide reductase beta subunit family protein with ferritin-like domain